MLQFPSQSSSSKQSLPRRIDSLAPGKAPLFSDIEDELRDIKRVHTHGQEEDLRMALSRMISRVEELSSLLKEAYKVQTDIQTELTLAKSNLQLALANNEMLEDALKRDVPGSSKDVGWRRWGAKEQSIRESELEKRRSMDSVRSIDVVAPSPSLASPGLPSAIPPSAATPSDGRFFKFRFGSTNTATTPHFPQSPRTPSGSASPVLNGYQTAHLTSASLPSLVPQKDKDKELEELAATLEKERKANKTAKAEKEALEAELESLSQALFEEANKMVASERMRLAETIDELREAQAEKEALRSALRLVESQRARPTDESDTESSFSPPLPPSSTQSLPLASSHKRTVSLSSAMGVKSLPSSAPSSAPSSPQSAMRIFPERPPSALRITSSPEPDLSTEDLQTPAAVNHAEIKVDNNIVDATIPSSSDLTLAQSSSSLSSSLPEPSSSPSSSSQELLPTPDSPEAQFVYVPPRPSVFYGEEEAVSPWADVKSVVVTPRVEA